MSEPQIWPHAIAALKRSRDAAGPHDSARFALSQLVIAFTGAGEMLAIGHVDGAIDLLADVEAATCDGCRKPLDATAEATGEAEAVTLCGVCRETAEREAAKRCQICGWPLAADRESGCVPGDCSYRPETGSDEHRRITARREALARAPCPACERPHDPQDCCQA